MPAASRTPFHRSVSSVRSRPNCSAVEPFTTTPAATRCSRTFSSAMISLSVLFSLVTTEGARPGGPKTPYQELHDSWHVRHCWKSVLVSDRECLEASSLDLADQRRNCVE